MTTETISLRERAYDAIIGDLVDLIMAQPHQALISSASVAIVASEAYHLIPMPFNVLMAVGAEWAYLRGIASSGKGDRWWTGALNWGALFLVVLYGMLWGARKFGGIPATPDQAWAWALTAVHILPVAWLSLAAAMVHRSVASTSAAERERRQADAEADQKERERRIFELELEQKKADAEAERWLKVQREKAQIKADAAPRMRALPDARNAGQESMDAQTCPGCGAHIPERSKYLAARRWGRCANCKES